MLLSHLEFPITCLPYSSMLNTHRLQASSLMVECTLVQPRVKTNLPPSSLKNNSPLSCFSICFNGHDSNGAFYRSISLGESYIRCQAKCNTTGLSEGQSSNPEHLEDICTNDKELQRRRKIGFANKGKEPWNRGRKHSAETREKIRMRTKEALSDPKIRKKMSECPRSFSEQTKSRMRTSARKIWDERLKRKRSRDKFLQSWAELIAEAAKRGSDNQDELEWDSYAKIMREISFQKSHWAAEKAKAKEWTRLKAERAAQTKAEKMERVARKKEEREERAKLKAEIKRRGRPKQEMEDLADTEKLELKARLIKIQKKSVGCQVSCQHQRAWEKLDIELIKREHLKNEISLEEQILLAKKKKAERLNENVPHSGGDCQESTQTQSSLFKLEHRSHRGRGMHRREESRQFGSNPLDVLSFHF